MADKKISQLTELTTAADDDSLVILDKDTDVTKRIEVSNLVGTNELLLKTASTLSSSPQAVQSVGDQVSALQISSVGVKASGTLTATGDSTLTNATLSGDLTLASGSSVNAIHDSDTLSQDSDTALATQQSIKAYVDAQILTEDTLEELNDVDISGKASGDIIIYQGDTWDNKQVSGDASMDNTGAVVVDGLQGRSVASTAPSDGESLAWDSGTSSWKPSSAGTGSVTSVAVTGSDGIDVDSGSPITTSGTIALGLSNIANSKLANSSVSYGGISLALGASDATPAFDLTDATNYEGTAIKSTGETGGTKFLREDGDGTCSWQDVSASGTVTSVATSGTVSGLTLTGGPITSTGTVTLGGTLSADLTSEVTGTLPVANGGTGVASFAIGDIIYASGETTLSKLAKGTSGQVLKMNSGETAPEWATDSDSGGTVTSVTAGSDSGSTTAITTSGTITFTGGTNVTTSAAGSTVTINSTDQYDGTVTSITPAADAGTGTAITGSGTLTNTGGTGIDTSVTGTTTTFDLDLNELTDVSGTDSNGWGSGDTIAIVDSGDNSSKRIMPPAEIGIACSDETTAIEGIGIKATIMIPRKMKLTEVKVSLTTKDTTGLQVQLEDRGTDPSASGTEILAAVINTSTNYYATSTSFNGSWSSGNQILDANDFVTVEVENAGDGASKGMKVWLLGYWA